MDTQPPASAPPGPDSTPATAPSVPSVLSVSSASPVSPVPSTQPPPPPPPPPPPSTQTQTPSVQIPPAKAPSPAKPSPATPSPIGPLSNSATHYPNGLPRTINGLNGVNGLNGTKTTAPVSPATGTSPQVPTPAQPTRPPLPPGSVITTTPSVSAPVAAPTAPMLTSTPLATATQTRPYLRQHQFIHHKPSTAPMRKVPIVDPAVTSSQSRNYAHPPQGFPSPRREHHLENPKYIDDLSRLTHAIQQSVPAAVRRVVRDNWEKSLLGSEFHHAFLLNAVIHHSNGGIIRRSIRDFGAKMVVESKAEIIEHLKSTDLDEVANAILSKASDYFLDKALEKRLRTIDARSLINALARAERLGYENSDVLDDRGGRDVAASTAPPFNPALVNPSPVPTQVHQSPSAQHRPSVPSLPASRGPPPVLQCRLCWRKFKTTATYEYHDLNHVCGDHGTAPATPKVLTNTGSPITLSSGTNSPVQPPSSLAAHPPKGQHQFPTSFQYTTTPRQSRGPPVVTPSSSAREQDPYAHLNQSTLDRLNEELRQAEISYTTRFKEAETIPDLDVRKVKLEGLQNSFSTKQSIIRKKYGVRLRNRRTKAEIDNERQRMGWKHPSPSHTEDMPSAKRQRTDDGPLRPSSQAPPPSSNVPEHKSNHLAVSDMKAGLGGSSATAATTDPTLPSSSAPSRPETPAENSLSSYQRKGYRVSSHLAQPNQVSPTDTTMGDSTIQRGGSASAPVIVDDDEDSTDTDSDGDIPASLPPRKTSGTPSRGLAG
ncbi:hypothetical protein AAE478_000757 [Parahypoxylon ruwenzoriense]